MQKISKALKFRIYPNISQKQYFRECFRCRNFIYNTFLSEQELISEILSFYGLKNKEELKEYRKEHKLYFNAYEASKVITKMKKDERYSFLKNVDSTITTIVLDDLANAFEKMIKEGGGYPNYKNIGKNKSFAGQIRYTTSNKPRSLNINYSGNNWCKINIPKLKDIKINIHHEDFTNNWADISKYKINRYTISESAGEVFHISLQVDIFVDDIILKPIKENKILGIDMGVVRPVTTSDEILSNNDILKTRFNLIKKYQSEITRLSRILATKKIRNTNWKKSNKYKRIKNKIAKLHAKIANIRKNMQHNITSTLIKSEYDTFIIEDLNIKGMMKKSAKGKSNNKKGLNRVLADTGIGEITRQLDYKSKWNGKNLIKVDAKYTSQVCSNCGHSHKDNRKKQDKFKCCNCGHEMNADLNAAKNIKNKFLKTIVNLKLK